MSDENSNLIDEDYQKQLTKYNDDLKEYEKKLDEYFDKHKAETEKRQISSSENFDKSVLTYSSWALGISIAFLKDFVPIDIANNAFLLYCSWYLFIISIGLTTVSFLVSYKSLEVSLKYAYEYYKNKNSEYADKTSYFTKTVEWFNYTSAFCFILGIAFTVIFASTNLEKAAMEKKVKRHIGQDGLPPSLMSKVVPPSKDFNKGITPSSMTKIPAPQPPPAPSKPSE
jgi:hypothetical protein